MLFEPFEFSGMRLKNHVVSVPVVSNLATEDGFVTDNLIDRYTRIAGGGIGWIIIEDVVVISRKSPYNLRIWYGVVTMMLISMGLVFPPVGMAAFVVSATANVELMKVYLGTSILVIAIILATVKIMIFPQIVLWLPSMM